MLRSTLEHAGREGVDPNSIHATGGLTRSVTSFRRRIYGGEADLRPPRWHFDCSVPDAETVAELAQRPPASAMGTEMSLNPLPDQSGTHRVRPIDSPFRGSTRVVLTRDHGVIRHWATERRAEPATGEATSSGPATSSVNDGGAGIRFNFPGVGTFRPIGWEEWLANFDHHECAFVYDDEPSRPLSNRYRIVKAQDWSDLLA
jgi:hypothetical protein